MPIAPPALVEGAARVALPYGLFSTFSLRPGGARWEAGVQFEVGTLGPAGGIGEPVEPANEVQTVTQGGAGLTSFTLTYAGQTTSAIPAASSAATVQAALIALSNIGPTDVVVSGPTSGPYVVTWQGTKALTNVAQMTATPTGGTGTVTVATTKAGANTLGLPKVLTKNTQDESLATPFTVYGHFASGVGGWSMEDAQRLANEHLLAREEARVEQALWTGDLGNSPKLQGAPSTTTVMGTAGDAVLALALLENYIAVTYGSMGVIHMSRLAATILLEHDVLTISGGRLTTKLGTAVAAGTGYPGTGPSGQAAAAGTAWIFATPMLFGYRSEIFTSSATPGDLFDRRQNNITAIAERTYLLGFDPVGVGAALITLA